jgi:hypothetical protein
MLAKALMTFYYQPTNLKINKGEVISIDDPMLFIDLYNAKFVEQIDRLHSED